jgi:hypothetical protein
MMAMPRQHLRSVPPPIAAGPPWVDVGATDAAERRRLSGPALRTWARLADRWGLSEAERLRVLGQPARSTYHAWLERARNRGDVVLPLDTLLRLSAAFGIHKGLALVFADEAEGLAWLRTSNGGPVFGGQRPLDLVTAGTQDGLLTVRRYLDAWRGGVFAAPNRADLEPVGEPIIVE